MADVKTSIEYRITIDDTSVLLDEGKFELLNYINEFGAISKAAELCDFTYRTALNYIGRIEKKLNLSIIETSKGGSGGGGSAKLTSDGLKILKECKKINAIMELHRDANEFEAEIVEIDKDRGVMKLKNGEILITIPLNKNYQVGDTLLAIISYDNIFVMMKPQKSSIRNVLKGTITELRLVGETIRVKIDVGGVDFYSDITQSSSNELRLDLGQEVFIGFKALAIATLKL